MKRNRHEAQLAALLLFGLFLNLSPSHALGQDGESAEEIAAQIAAFRLPGFDPARGDDDAYAEKYFAELKQAQLESAALILKLYEADPQHKLLPEVMPKRWQLLTELGEFDPIYSECEKILEQQDLPLRVEAAFALANVKATEHKFNTEVVLPPLRRFMELAPKDDRAATLLFRCAQYGAEEHAVRRELLAEMLASYPESFYAQYATGMLRQLDGIGQPFELAFTDALTEQHVSIEKLQGKIVVLDFWATWCGPCLAEMPSLKALYAKYQPEGVEFIGISLDVEEARGGKQQLIEYCRQNEITWPQYYQGNKYDSEFSHGWGISAIPRAFVIDWEGKLHSVDARGKLDELLPAMLKQRDAQQK